MKPHLLRLSFGLLCICLAPAVASAYEPTCVGPGHGGAVPGPRENPCPGSELQLTFDGTAEASCSWVLDGVAPPDWGAWAEGYEATGTICGIQFWFSALEGWQHGQTLDAYIYDSDGVNPAQVLAVVVGIDPGPIALWYDISVHDVAMPETPVDGEVFVGYWGNWPGEDSPGWGTCCDLDGPQGKPRTKIAPGIGFPTGWNDPSIVFGPTHNVAMGPWIRSPGVPVQPSTWGSVKSLYR